MGVPYNYANVPTEYNDDHLLNSDDLIIDLQELLEAFQITPAQKVIYHVRHCISVASGNILFHRCYRCVLRTGLHSNRTKIIRCTPKQHSIADMVSSIMSWLGVFLGVLTISLMI
jgi:hypothetical protein